MFGPGPAVVNPSREQEAFRDSVRFGSGLVRVWLGSDPVHFGSALDRLGDASVLFRFGSILPRSGSVPVGPCPGPL